MGKHKVVKKYVAFIDDMYPKVQPEAVLVHCEFVQTAKQLRLAVTPTQQPLSRRYTYACRAIGYRSTLPLDSNWVHDSPMAACKAAIAEQARQVEIAEARLKRERERLVAFSALLSQVESDLKLMS